MEPLNVITDNNDQKSVLLHTKMNGVKCLSEKTVSFSLPNYGNNRKNKENMRILPGNQNRLKETEEVFQIEQCPRQKAEEQNQVLAEEKRMLEEKNQTLVAKIQELELGYQEMERKNKVSKGEIQLLEKKIKALNDETQELQEKSQASKETTTSLTNLWQKERRQRQVLEKLCQGKHGAMLLFATELKELQAKTSRVSYLAFWLLLLLSRLLPQLVSTTAMLALPLLKFALRVTTIVSTALLHILGKLLGRFCASNIVSLQALWIERLHQSLKEILYRWTTIVVNRFCRRRKATEDLQFDDWSSFEQAVSY